MKRLQVAVGLCFSAAFAFAAAPGDAVTNGVTTVLATPERGLEPVRDEIRALRAGGQAKGTVVVDLAPGVYRMTGGTFNGGTGTVSIGLNGGKGTLEFGAGNGSFAAANLNLSGSNSMLKFVLGADGSVIRPNVTSMLTIGTGAKLVVDSTAYRGAAVTLMTFGAASGSFAAADISLVGAPNGKLTQSGSSLRFIPEPHGLVLIVR